MAIKIKVQRDYYLTEGSMELPTEVGELNDVLLAIKTTGKMVVVYNQGNIQGINVEQRTKLTDSQAEKIRSLLEIPDKIL